MIYRAIGIGVLLAALVWSYAFPMDSGQWDKSDPVVQWYEKIMQPDVPTASCCGAADSYWADDVYTRDGKTYARITDDRPDEPLGRPHRNIGTEFEIPNNKLKWGDNDPQKYAQPAIERNPTGHSLIFLSRGDYVFCFVFNGGV